MSESPNALRRILVTGATGSLGKSIALRLSRDGFHVSLHCRSRMDVAEKLQAEIEEKGGSADILNFDITDRTRTRACLEATMEQCGAYYGVVCNAGIHRDNPFPGLKDEEWDSVIDTSLHGFFNVVQPLILPMIRLRMGGRIVCVSSVSGVIGHRGQVNYSAAKAGLIGAAKALAVELASRSITVNSVAPGLIESEMADSLVPEAMEQALAAVPMKRMGRSQEVADTIAFLCSDSASYITRQVIGVNGGLI